MPYKRLVPIAPGRSVVLVTLVGRAAVALVLTSTNVHWTWTTVIFIALATIMPVLLLARAIQGLLAAVQLALM